MAALYSPLMFPFLLLIPLLLLMKKMKAAKRLNHQLPPSPPRLPILGNIHQLGARPHQSFRKLSQKYGPVMLLKFGRIPFVIISSAEAAREVLKTHDLDTCSRARFTGSQKLTYNYSDILFAPYGDYWREMRKICVLELFSLKRVHSYRFIREEEIASLMNSISRSSSSGTPVDLSEKLFALTGSIVFRMAFGTIFRGNNLDNHKFKDLVHDVEALLAAFTAEECFPYGGWILDRLSGYHAKLERVFNELDTFFQRVIEDHLKTHRTKQEHNDIVDVMLNIKAKQYDEAEVGAAWLSNDHIKAILLNMFLGGTDTSAITLLWAMTELARNPRVMSKAQDEIRNCVGKNGKVTEDDIGHLPYLKMVIKETLRLHPPAPLLVVRETINHFKVDGFDIYPGTMIQVNVWAIGKDPNYWKNPEEFYPERFIDNPIDFKGQNFEFLPFGAGRRNCPGMQIGVITTHLTLANLLFCFNWKLPSGMDMEDINMEETVGQCLTVSKKTPLHLVPVNYLQ